MSIDDAIKTAKMFHTRDKGVVVIMSNETALAEMGCAVGEDDKDSP